MKAIFISVLFSIVGFHQAISQNCNATIGLTGPSTFCEGGFVDLSVNNVFQAWRRFRNHPLPGLGVAVSFSIGNKGYMGTGESVSGLQNEFWEFDPYIDQWTRMADFPGGPRYSVTGFSIGYKGYIGFGSDAQGVLYRDFWEYDPATNIWTRKADCPGAGRYGAVGFSIGTKGYVGTGDAKGPVKDFWEYDPALDKWTQKADLGGDARAFASGFAIGNKGYIGIGRGLFSNSNTSTADFWEYDPLLDHWTQKADFAGGREGFMATVATDNRAYLGARNTGGTNKKAWWEYNPLQDSWTKREDMPVNNIDQSTAFSIDNFVYLAVGRANGATDDFYIYTPGMVVWSTGDTSRSLRVTSSGIYSAIFTDQNGCTATAAPVTIQVRPRPSFTAVVSEGFCAGNNTTGGSISITASGGNGTYSYSIDNGAHYVSNNIFTGLAAGTYVVTAGSNDCASLPQYIVIPAEVDQSPPVLACSLNMSVSPASLAGRVVNFTPPVVTDNCSVSSLQQTAGLPPGSIFPIGTTTVTYKASDPAGNVSYCSFSVTVRDPYCDNNTKVAICHSGQSLCLDAADIPAHLAHGDKLGTCSKDNLPITGKQSKPGISIFPNPSNGRFSIQLNEVKAARGSLLIMDGFGQIVYQKTIDKTAFSGNFSVDPSLKTKGAYLVKYVTATGIYSSMLIVQ